ncbi:MAG: hypoxanthine phosphoribosyltransferase [Vicinamibacteria bacterium]|nr:hypoxanthine phosphoribosyltransferase [Vicinamibacteria bacterium]
MKQGAKTMRDKPALLFSPEQIQKRVAELGAELGRTYAGEEICVVGLMKSCLVFMADLIRSVPLEMTCHFLQSSSLKEIETAATCTDIIYSSDIPYEDRHVLLLDDIIDTGITLSFLLDHIREHGPRSLRVCVLIDKPGERKVELTPDWAAFTLNEPLGRFIVGYGMALDERYRELPYLGSIPLPAARRETGGAS